jgi:hypothetical protein
MTLAIGLDVANWQIYFNPDNASGVVDFAFQKVTDGIYAHSALETMWAGVKKIWVRGAYHYQRNGNWQAQADKFLAVAGAKDFHIYALDVEGANNVVDNTFLFDTQRIINYWISKTNKRVVIYTNIDYYKQMRALGLGNWLDTIPLWIASPNLNPGAPSLPPYRTTWTFHQYSWWGEPARWGTGGKTDEDVYNGTVEQLRQWAGANIPPTGETMTIYDIKGAMNIRAAASITSTDVGDLFIGDRVEVTVVQISATDKWGKLSKITRAGANVALPAAVCYVSLNTTGTVEYIPPVADSITMDITLHDVKVAGDVYTAVGVKANKVT